MIEVKSKSTYYEPFDNSNGGADFSLVVLDSYFKPACKEHGAMNKVSSTTSGGLWRCLRSKSSPKCRAGCKEK